MSVSTVIEKMTTIQAQLKELASEVENIQISFDGQVSANAIPKMEAITPSNFVGAVIVQEEYTEVLIGHLRSRLNFLANSLYPNSRGAALSAEATRAMAAKLAPRNTGLPFTGETLGPINERTKASVDKATPVENII